MLKRAHAAGQWSFMRVEGVFNAAFGDRLNPLYYLGPISYFLLWIAVGTGLILYALFETSVIGAYDSVDALSRDHPWSGGLLRSLHRYASDGVILTMLLHLVRHWSFDRYRGFRWFSWVSGVALLWLVYTVGINGYMLPWDRLSQFVVVATAEWFDWLPVFNGALVRNFIFTENVSDRLFSLLAFIHIGVSLVILAILWVHTQRVPQARTVPPLPIALGLTGAMVALSLAAPAMSQARADLALAVTDLEFDWFYLPAYALLYRTSPATLWMVLAGASLLFLLLPWLPPRRRALAGDLSHVLVRPDNRIVPVRDGETVLDAGLREGIAFPFDCRSGGCGRCKATLTAGRIDYGNCQPGVLTDAERADGKFLLCTAVALGDIEVAYEPETAPGGLAPRLWNARVALIEPLSHDVKRVVLNVEGGEAPEFYAGQYLNILLEDGEKRAFSFATAPRRSPEVELQIRLIPGGRFTTHVFEAMKPGDAIRFEGPLGAFFLREESDKPIIFVAGSTGFAPVKSMVEYAFQRGMTRRMLLYWGARRLRDLYLPELPRQWAREHPNFEFIPVLSDAAPEDAWTGRTGLVHEAILEDFPDLGAYQVYACGSAGMVEAAYPAFRAHGLSADECFSDAFRLTPALRSEQVDLVKPGGGA
ncbi:MAG TPA: 2Fe-2S iron-sulfur cluster-binding protein [Burkholderiales bacterium]